MHRLVSQRRRHESATASAWTATSRPRTRFGEQRSTAWGRFGRNGLKYRMASSVVHGLYRALALGSLKPRLVVRTLSRSARASSMSNGFASNRQIRCRNSQLIRPGDAVVTTTRRRYFGCVCSRYPRSSSPPISGSMRSTIRRSYATDASRSIAAAAVLTPSTTKFSRSSTILTSLRMAPSSSTMSARYDDRRSMCIPAARPLPRNGERRSRDDRGKAAPRAGRGR